MKGGPTMRSTTLFQLALYCLVAMPLTVSSSRRCAGNVFRGGRRLLVGSSYVLPKDASEDERLDAQHYLLGLVTGALHLAPLAAPRTMLDVGCGTGLWCKEMAAQFPNASLIGLDFDIERLKNRSRPRNVQWQEVNALDPLPFISNSFDYIHVRFAATWIPFGRWPDVLAELLRVTRPGGIIELTEGSMPQSASQAYTNLGKTFDLLLRQRGINAHLPAHLAELLRHAGLEDVQEQTFTSGTTDEQQHLLFETTAQGFKALLPLLQKQLAPGDYVTYLANLAEVIQTQPHVTRRDVVAFGRKPKAV